eukprot:5011452-Prymnesium_polylepis.1
MRPAREAQQALVAARRAARWRAMARRAHLKIWTSYGNRRSTSARSWLVGDTEKPGPQVLNTWSTRQLGLAASSICGKRIFRPGG